MAMHLVSDRGEFELAFSRESLPQVQDGLGDSRWATARVRVATLDEEWEEEAPCLNMFEFVNLAEWLESVGGLGGDVPEIELLQPDLRFSVVRTGKKKGDGEGKVTVRIKFHLSDRPEEFNVDAPTDEADHLDLDITRESARVAAASLRAAIEAVSTGGMKDDLDGDDDVGQLGQPDEDLNLVDGVAAEPPFAGDGEDNAGQR